jgi:hypothetical protein
VRIAECGICYLLFFGRFFMRCRPQATTPHEAVTFSALPRSGSGSRFHFLTGTQTNPMPTLLHRDARSGNDFSTGSGSIRRRPAPLPLGHPRRSRTVETMITATRTKNSLSPRS